MFDHHNPVYMPTEKNKSRFEIVAKKGLIHLPQVSLHPVSTNSLSLKFNLGIRYLLTGSYWNYIFYEGHFYIMPEGFDVKHTSISKGNEIIAAGKIKIINGRLLFIDNDSGHYHPHPRTVAYALFHLKELGVDISLAEVDLIGFDSR